MKFFYSAFVAAPALFRRGDVKFSSSAHLSSVSNFNVGGNKFTVFDEDIEKHPSSLLLQLANSAPIIGKEKDEINIGRSGALFKHVYAFLVNGQLPRNDEGYIALDEKTLTDLQAEADFYGLQALSDECKIHRKKAPDVESYMTIRKYLERSVKREGSGSVEFQRNSKLTRVLKSFRSPFCLIGNIERYPYSSRRCRDPLFKNSSETSVNVEELIAAATQSPFGRGTETVLDTDVRNSFEINASELNQVVLKKLGERYDLNTFAPHLDLTLRPYKLVIYKEGGHFDAHRDTVRGDGHIGTLVVILNSEYTGGELEVTHGGRTEVVTGPYSWVAMYGDCLHKINPVTSGTRVSLIYDIYGTMPTEDSLDDDTAGADCNDDYQEELCRPDWEYDSHDKARPPREEQKTLLRECLDKELVNHDSVVVCLEHLYPQSQANPSFLKGGDRALYDLIREHDAYDVEVVAATIYSHQYGNSEEDADMEIECSLFSPTIVQRALANSPAVKEKTKFVLTTELCSKELLDYSPFIDYTGNESQEMESVYLVAGLQVRKKKV